MKPTRFTAGRILFALAFLGLSLILVSWNLKQSSRNFQAITDTIPDKPAKPTAPDKPKKITDLDDVLDELNAVDLKVEMEKIHKELAETMKQFDKDKLKMDLDKVKIEMDKAMKEVDFDKIRKEVEGSMAKIDWEKMKKELEEVKEMNLEKLQVDMKQVAEELKKIGPQLEKEMEKAKVEIEKAKVEMKEFKVFVDGLEKDGLLNKKEPYTIKHKDGELSVNGKKVSAETYNKYKSFLEKHKYFTIEKSADDFNIDID
jgi:hypothetical protein